MTILTFANSLTTINSAIVQALQLTDTDALSHLAEQQQQVVADLFAALQGDLPSDEITALLQNTVQLNETAFAQLSLQKQALANAQFDLKRRTQATLHYTETGQL